MYNVFLAFCIVLAVLVRLAAAFNVSVECSVISCGYEHCCARSSSGDVKCWGHALWGRVGLAGVGGDIGDNELVYEVDTVSVQNQDPFARVVSVHAGHAMSCARFTNGKVKCWGGGSYGELGFANYTANPNKNDARNDIGDDEKPSSVPVWTTLSKAGESVRQIAVGYLHSCALMSTGGVRCWGDNDVGRLGHGNLDHIGATAPIWSYGDLNLTTDDVSVVQVACGGVQSCALFDNGKIKCWGGGSFGELGYGPAFTPYPSSANAANDIGDDEVPAAVNAYMNISENPVVQICLGQYHGCALLDNGRVRCYVKSWGRGDNGRLGYGNTNNIGDDEDPAAAGDVSITTEGTLVQQVSCGQEHTCVLLVNGKVKCWGYNEFGQLGFGDTWWIGNDELPSSKDAFVQFHETAPINITVIDAGARHNCALSLSYGVSALYCWGTGDHGRTGHGNTFAIGNNEQVYDGGLTLLGSSFLTMTDSCSLDPTEAPTLAPTPSPSTSPTLSPTPSPTISCGGHGDYSLASGACACNGGWYLTEATAIDCTACPIGHYCASSIATECPAGSISLSERRAECTPCLQPSRCLGGAICAAEYTGAMCLDCTTDYFSLGGGCVRCRYSTTMVGIICGVLLVVVLLLYRLRLEKEDISTFKIMFDFVAALSITFHVRIWLPLPPVLRELYELLRVLELDLALLAPECLVDVSWYVRGMLMPVFFAALVSALFMAVTYALHSRFSAAVRNNAVNDVRLRRLARYRRSFRLTVLVSLAAFSPIVAALLRVSHCLRFEGHTVLVYDTTNVECWAGATQPLMFALGLVLALVFVGAVISFIVLRILRIVSVVNYVQAEDKSQYTWGALYLNYKPERFYWEAVVLARRFVMICLISIPNASALLLTQCALTLVFLAVVAWQRPFVVEYISLCGVHLSAFNTLYLVALVIVAVNQLILAILSFMADASDGVRWTIGVLLVVFNVVTIIFAVVIRLSLWRQGRYRESYVDRRASTNLTELFSDGQGDGKTSRVRRDARSPPSSPRRRRQKQEGGDSGSGSDDDDGGDNDDGVDTAGAVQAVAEAASRSGAAATALDSVEGVSRDALRGRKTFGDEKSLMKLGKATIVDMSDADILRTYCPRFVDARENFAALLERGEKKLAVNALTRIQQTRAHYKQEIADSLSTYRATDEVEAVLNCERVLQLLELYHADKATMQVQSFVMQCRSDIKDALRHLADALRKFAGSDWSRLDTSSGADTFATFDNDLATARAAVADAAGQCTTKLRAARKAALNSELIDESLKAMACWKGRLGVNSEMCARIAALMSELDALQKVDVGDAKSSKKQERMLKKASGLVNDAHQLLVDGAMPSNANVWPSRELAACLVDMAASARTTIAHLLSFVSVSLPPDVAGASKYIKAQQQAMMKAASEIARGETADSMSLSPGDRQKLALTTGVRMKCEVVEELKRRRASAAAVIESATDAQQFVVVERVQAIVGLLDCEISRLEK